MAILPYWKYIKRNLVGRNVAEAPYWKHIKRTLVGQKLAILPH